MAEPDVSGPGQLGILICDDDAGIRALLATIVERDPTFHVVGYADDGNEAVVRAKELQPDVIILDLAMPNRNGLEALPGLAEAAPNARTIVVSAFAASGMISEAMRRGAVRYLEKGLAIDELLLAIRAVVDSSPADAP